MLSRTAENLFWLSRYMERAENLSRILDVAARMATLPSAYAGVSNEWESALATAMCVEGFYKTYEHATRENVVSYIVAAPENPNSIKAWRARISSIAGRTPGSARMTTLKDFSRRKANTWP